MINNSHSTPINKTAARVIGKGVSYTPDKKVQTIESKNPLPIRFPTVMVARNPSFVDCTGKKRGRLTVVGMYGLGSGWVCRCDCGMYCVRRKKSILNEKNKMERCEECRHLAFIKRDEKRRRTGKDVDLNDY
jgi:hypothetical protein